jgi:hypothetical protein
MRKKEQQVVGFEASLVGRRLNDNAISVCPLCGSSRDMIQSPWGTGKICDKPACTYKRALQKSGNNASLNFA